MGSISEWDILFNPIRIALEIWSLWWDEIIYIPIGVEGITGAVL